MFLMIKGTIHKENRHHKILDTLTTKKQRYISKNQKKYNGKEKYIIIVRHIDISLRIFYQVQKK